MKNSSHISANDQDDPKVLRKAVVHIVGPNRLQNKLLCTVLTKKAGIKCTWSLSLDTAGPFHPHPEAPYVLLFDCLQTDLPRLWPLIALGSHVTAPRCYIALFNVNSELGLEKEALDRGVRGIFHEDDDVETLAKGLVSLMAGQLWYSRETLSKCLLEQKRWKKVSHETIAVTHREKEILVKLASGMSNKEIALELCVSTHTVKSHIYNLYKKIGVPNRLQAVLWGITHL